MSKHDERPPLHMNEPKWGVFNWGTLWQVFHFRQDALELARKTAAENGYTRDTWQRLFEIRKLRVSLWTGERTRKDSLKGRK